MTEALTAESPENGMHALGHFHASVLLDAGENVKALAEYLGHSDPGLKLRVYAHLMLSGRERTRKAVASVFADRGVQMRVTDGLRSQSKPMNERRRS